MRLDLRWANMISTEGRGELMLVLDRGGDDAANDF